MNVLLTSVPRSGTHFVQALLNGKIHYEFDHLYQTKMVPFRKKLVRGYVPVVPMRHPFRVMATNKFHHGRVPHVVDFFRRLAWVVHPFNPVYIPVDSFNREEYLAEASNRLGLPLETDWKPAASCGKDVRLLPAELTIACDLLDELYDIFGQFGYTEDNAWQS